MAVADGVLVTGGSGFLGRSAVAALAKGDGPEGPVVSADLRILEPDQRVPGVVYATADVTDRGAIGDLIGEHGVGTVVHLASIVNPGRDTTPEREYEVDVEGSRNVLEASVEHGVRRIVISSSGMATGGRVLHHLKAALPDPRFTVLFVGYQAAGTRGRSLVDGEDEVKIHGTMVPVRAQIDKIDSMSAHADRSEVLRWLGHFERPPRMTYLVHGEPEPMAALESAISESLGWHVHKPQHLEEVGV